MFDEGKGHNMLPMAWIGRGANAYSSLFEPKNKKKIKNLTLSAHERIIYYPALVQSHLVYSTVNVAPWDSITFSINPRFIFPRIFIDKVFRMPQKFENNETKMKIYPRMLGLAVTSFAQVATSWWLVVRVASNLYACFFNRLISPQPIKRFCLWIFWSWGKEYVKVMLQFHEVPTRLAATMAN